MDKIIYLWLEMLREKYNEITIKYINNMTISNIKALFKKENINSMKLHESIIKCFLDKNIKEKAIKIYERIESEKMKIITIKDEDFPKKLKQDKDCPFCIIVSDNYKYNLNNKFVYLYYAPYFSKSAKYILKYNYNVLTELNYNIICECEEVSSIKIGYLENNLNSNNDMILFISNKTDINKLIDVCILVEARYENLIVNKVNYFVDNFKPVLVFPNSILNKNAYFSNYLIKQGADIILGKSDLLFILKGLSC